MAETTLALAINLGSVEAIPLGQGRCYIVGNQEIAVFRQRDGRLFATHNRCPHRQGPLADGMVGNGKVLCPLHGHQFNLDTGASNDASECVRVFPVQAVGGDILLSGDDAALAAAPARAMAAPLLKDR